MTRGMPSPEPLLAAWMYTNTSQELMWCVRTAKYSRFAKAVADLDPVHLISRNRAFPQLIQATRSCTIASYMVSLDAAALQAASAAYPKPSTFQPNYGTAGFRAEASLLPSTVFRCGLLIGLRAKSTGQVRVDSVRLCSAHCQQGQGLVCNTSVGVRVGEQGLPCSEVQLMARVLIYHSSVSLGRPYRMQAASTACLCVLRHAPACPPPPSHHPHLTTIPPQACGVMITASHNPETDNGVKLVEPSGEMLAPDWEAHATALAQAATDEQLATLVLALANSTTPAPSTSQPASNTSSSANGTEAHSAPASAATAGRCTVLIGRDTRPSGEDLVAACRAGVLAVGAHVMDVGVVSTPELHFCVQTYNQYHAVQEASYFTNLLESYRNLSRGASSPQQPVHVDCANGVGALKLQHMLPQLQQLGLELVLYNTGEGRLNHLCGADYVQKEQTYPAGACQ